LCAFLSAAFDNARPKPVDIFLPPLRLPPMVLLCVVSLPLDDVQKAMCVSGARVFVLEETSRLAAALKLHFSRARAETTFSKHRERRAPFRREKNTRRERKERESFILLSSIARIKSIRSFGKRARRSRPIAFRGNQTNGSNHIEKSKRLHTHTHIKSSWRQKSSA